ncbi:MAG: hypothetical protein Pars2KO_12670 [Parasphingorhabdus sp.]
MANLDDEYYTSNPDPDNHGWFQWVLRDPECYNSFLGPIIIRRGGDGLGDDIGRVRMFPERRHRNMGDVVHGGTMMGFIDCSLFAAMRVFDIGPAGPSVTLELQTHFTGAANMDEPLEARVEVTRETGRFLFMRGLVVQGDEVDNVASFTAIVKKAPRPKNPDA